MDKVGDFLSDHEEGIYAFLDGIGCILLHGPSIGRTIDRIDRWIGDSDDNSHQNNNRENVQEDNNFKILTLCSKNLKKKYSRQILTL